MRTFIFMALTLLLAFVHGAIVMGTQGAPGAPTALAAITAGFVGALHKPKGTIFTKGIKSIFVAAGFFDTDTRCIGKTPSGVGILGIRDCEHEI